MKIVHGQNWLVTGAASGIGRLMALELAKKGANVILVDINQENLKKVESEVRAMGKGAISFYCDLGKPTTFLDLKQDIHSRVGKIHGLINNAGVVFGGEFEKIPLQKHFLTYEINMLGPMALAYTFFNDFLEARESHLVNIASASGFVGLPFGSTYASSKWGIIGFSDSIRLEMRERGYNQVHVTTVCPSYIATGMFNGVKAPILIPWLKPEAIVAKIITGIEKNQAFIKEPFLVKTIDLLKGTMPLSWSDAISKFLGVTSSMFHWRGR